MEDRGSNCTIWVEAVTTIGIGLNSNLLVASPLLPKVSQVSLVFQGCWHGVSWCSRPNDVSLLLVFLGSATYSYSIFAYIHVVLKYRRSEYKTATSTLDNETRLAGKLPFSLLSLPCLITREIQRVYQSHSESQWGRWGTVPFPASRREWEALPCLKAREAWT